MYYISGNAPRCATLGTLRRFDDGQSVYYISGNAPLVLHPQALRRFDNGLSMDHGRELAPLEHLSNDDKKHWLLQSGADVQCLAVCAP